MIALQIPPVLDDEFDDVEAWESHIACSVQKTGTAQVLEFHCPESYDEHERRVFRAEEKRIRRARAEHVRWVEEARSVRERYAAEQAKHAEEVRLLHEACEAELIRREEREQSARERYAAYVARAKAYMEIVPTQPLSPIDHAQAHVARQVRGEFLP